MRFLSQTAAIALLACRVLGHPAPSSSSTHGIQKRTVDLSAYKLGIGAQYTNNVVITEQEPAFRPFAGPSYINTATSVVRSTFAGAEFRLISDYVSGNGVAHVVFKQTVHGIDIDTADFNVNVRSCFDAGVFLTDKTRLRKMASFCPTEIPFTMDLFLTQIR